MGAVFTTYHGIRRQSKRFLVSIGKKYAGLRSWNEVAIRIRECCPKGDNLGPCTIFRIHKNNISGYRFVPESIHNDLNLITLFNHSGFRSEEPTSELQSLMRTSNAVFCLK